MILGLFYSGFRDPNMIAIEMRSSDIPFLDVNMLSQVTISCTNDFAMSSVNFLYVTEWHPNLTFSVIVWMDTLIPPTCSFAAHVCICAGDKNSQRISNSL